MTVPISVSGTRHQVWFRVSEGSVGLGSEIGTAAALVCAMRTGELLRVEGGLSAKWLRHLTTIQQVLHSWNPQLQCVPVEAQARPTSAPASGVACFFSGGVDSFASVLANQARITALIFVHGFDIALDKAALRAQVSGVLRSAAQELGKPLVEVETNVREIIDPYADWGDYGHGAGLASVLHVLAPHYGTVLVPATYSYRHLHANGSHPLLDPLWSTDEVEVVHDGAHLERFERLALAMQSPTARKSLRVCWRNSGGAFNCGRCEKCLRTLAELRLIGALGQCETLPGQLDLRALARVPLHDPHKWAFFHEMLLEAECRRTDPALIRALRQALKKRHPTTPPLQRIAHLGARGLRAIGGERAVRATKRALGMTR